jgi:exonuclease SbcC
LYGKEIEKIDFQISENREEIRASKESKQILKELEKKYEKYEKLSQIIRGKREELQELEEKNEKYLEYTGELEVLERKKIEISSKNENLKNLIAEKKKLQENFEEQARRLREKIKDEMYSLERIEKEIVSLDPKIEISSKMEETRIKYEFNLKENQIQQKKVLENLEEKKISLAKIDLVKLEKEIKNLEQKNLEKEKIKNKIINIETLQKSNEEAKINLSSSICPFLNESCKNLGNLDVEKYFYEREKKYKNELEVEKEKLKKLEIELQNLNALKEEEILGKKLQIDIEKEENELEKYSLKKENIELHLIKLEREQKEFQEENGNLEKLKERKIQLQTQISTLNLEGTQKNLDWEEENLRKIAQEINEILLEREETEKNQEEIESFKEKCLEKISNFIKYNVKFQEESENFKSLQTELENLRESYDLYIKNYEKAQNLERLLEKEKDLEQEILLQKIKMEKNLNDLIEKVNSLPSKEEIENLYNIREKNKNSLENFIREVGMLERNEKELAEKITKAEIQREIYGKTLLKKKKLKEKLNLTKIFRNKVKNMGTHVAENIIREISFYATSNFRKITGRTESIEWSNLDPEGKESPYCVTLKGGDRNIIFEQLSGGEQVAVAIAIRGAMNNLFTRTAFAIFDEPTNNLDIERRKSLADNIGEILKDLEQSIIVTHDDTFREMAQKVIFLAENR